MNRITNITNTNFTVAMNRNIKYIVIHYVGAVSSAQANGDYFKDAYRGASAHYFIDENDCVQVVDDEDTSWHCGTTGAYKHPYCRNTNSIGIEMCCKNNGNWYFEQATIDNTIELVKELMAKYNIPVENVIRHYDVTGKICPQPYVINEQAWNDFKAKLGQTQEQPTQQFQPYKVQVTVNGLRRREQPNTNSNVLGNYNIGDVVNIMDQVDNWGNDSNGAWICLDYTKSYIAVVQPQNKWYALYKTNATINVRSGAGLNYTVLKLYKQGQEFNICEENNGWGHTPSGWVKLSFCTKI